MPLTPLKFCFDIKWHFFHYRVLQLGFVMLVWEKLEVTVLKPGTNFLLHYMNLLTDGHSRANLDFPFSEIHSGSNLQI